MTIVTTNMFPASTIGPSASVIREQQKRQAKSMLGNEKSSLMIAQSVRSAHTDTDVAT